VKRIAIGGSGIAGISAARVLREAGFEVMVYEKARGVGGRLATRRLQDSSGGVYWGDHGAQYFSVFSPEFEEVLGGWVSDGLVRRWFDKGGTPRWCGSQGMSRLIKSMGSEITVQFEAKLQSISSELKSTGETLFGLEYKQGLNAELCRSPQFDGVILTFPTPQLVSLFEASSLPSIQHPIYESSLRTLRELQYDPCIAALFLVDGPIHLGSEGFRNFSDEKNPNIGWIASSRIKSGAEQQAHSLKDVLTVHMSASWSASHFDQSEDWITEEVWRELVALGVLDAQVPVLSKSLQKWRYSIPRTIHPDRFLQIASETPLFCAGDVFGGPRVEGAFLSGLAAAQALIRHFSR
jgi:renalase